MSIALIRAGKVENIVEASLEFAVSLGYDHAVEIAPGQVGIGDDYDGFGFYTPILALDALKAEKIAALRIHFEGLVASVKSACAPYEIDTWETQRAEYMAWQSNSLTPTPYVSALAEARGLAVAELMAKIAPKVAGMATIQGTQHALEKQVESATTIAQVEAITW